MREMMVAKETTRPQTAPRLNPQIVRTRNAVLEATLDLIAEVSVGALTIDQISERSAVARSTIYRHWNAPSEIVIDAFATLIGEVPPGPVGGGFVEELTFNYEFLMDGLATGNWARFLPAMIEAARVDAAYRKVFHRLLDERRSYGRDILRRAVARGDLPKDIDGDWMLDAISGPLYYRAVIWNDPIRDRAELHNLIAMVTDWALSGKSPRKPSNGS
ncbi:MAG: TetR/AcrR family transcriptional regulator [Caulobacterales bacterium]|nr:TetR/AcrR family transcriptional regulator [Caulobacterales bacterium]